MKPMAAALGLLLLGAAIGMSLALLFPWQRIGGNSKHTESPAPRAVDSSFGGQIAATDTNNGAAKGIAAQGRPEGVVFDAVAAPSGQRSTGSGSAVTDVPPVVATEASGGPTSPRAYVYNPTSASETSRSPDPRAEDNVARQALLALPSEIVVPIGAKVPAVFLEDRPLPGPQRGFLERVADRFIETVSQAAPGQEQEVWEEARNAADQKYIKLYGFEEFDALHRSAALDALREKRAMGQP